jgi:muramoyltetrapeptide carboxypeptidase
LDRRKFIWIGSLFASYPAFAKGLKSISVPNPNDSLNTIGSVISPLPINESFSNNPVEISENKSPITPPLLTKGSKVAITSPSSTTNVWELSNTIKVLKALGLEVVLGKTITDQKNSYRYLSAPDEVRAAEFNEFVKREDISAIIASRGGYGSMRMIQSIDFEQIKKFPKIYLGFSDFTFVLNAISKICNLITYHGPVGISSFTNFTKEYFVKTLFKNDLKDLKIQYNNLTILNPGKAEGKLIGGNLTMLASSLGTKYEFDSDNSIIFLEEVSEHAYQVDRLLNQLKLAGKFDNVKAIIFGQFTNLNIRRPFYPNRGFSIYEVIQQIILPLKVPTVLNFPIGHISDQVVMPLMTLSTLDTSSKTLTIFNH